jgi:DNA-binding GntR family transcriptional regulator
VGPLRDALRSLEADGIVTIHPRAGIEFVKPGMELARATYQFRGIMETAAVAVYSETGDEAEMEDLERRHLRAVEVVEASGLSQEMRDELEELEALLHNAIVGSLRNPIIDRSYRRVHNYLRILRLDRKITSPLALRSLREHLAIIAACRRRNADEAQAALATHFANALQRNMGLY